MKVPLKICSFHKGKKLLAIMPLEKIQTLLFDWLSMPQPYIYIERWHSLELFANTPCSG